MITRLVQSLLVATALAMSAPALALSAPAGAAGVSAAPLRIDKGRIDKALA